MKHTRKLTEIALRYEKQLSCRPITEQNARTRVILFRMIARELIQKYRDAFDRMRISERMREKARRRGLCFPAFDRFVREMRDEAGKRRDGIAEFGGGLVIALDAWQEAGAAFSDLCNLCCISEQRGREILGEEEMSFSEAVFAGDLDRKDKGDSSWRERDAPLTYSVKEFFLESVLETESGRAGCREAFQAAFPGLWDELARFRKTGSRDTCEDPTERDSS